MTDSVTYRRPESVLVLVYTIAADVLLLLRSEPSDFWQSVTGALEVDEQPLDAAIRELKEETGLRVDQLNASIVDHKRSSRFEIKGAWRKRYSPEITHNEEHIFSLCLPQQVEPQLDPTEHTAFIWLPAAKAIELAASATNRSVIHEYVLNSEAE